MQGFEVIKHKRTGYCGTFRKIDEGKTITVHGWVQRRRALGGLIFVDLRDRSGILQITFDETQNKDIFDKAYTLRAEDVISVTGVVRKRGDANTKISTGEIEVLANDLLMVAMAAPWIPQWNR